MKLQNKLRLELSSLRLGPYDFVGHDDADDNSEESEGAAEDLDDEHTYEGGRGLGVGEGSAGADTSDREATAQVAHADDKANAEDAVGGELRVLPDGRGVEQPTWRL